MSKRRDTEAKSELPTVEAPPLAASAGTPSAPAESASPETQIALDLIETLKAEAPKEASRIEPVITEVPPIETPPAKAPAVEIENPAPLAELPKPIEIPKIVEPKKAEPAASAPPASAEPSVGADEGTERRSSNRFMLLAASVALAAAIGSLTGVLAASGIAWLASSPPQPPTPVADVGLNALKDGVAKLRSEIAALRAGVDTSTRSNNAQFAKVTERIDRIDRKTESAKLAKTAESQADAAKDVTGSITPLPRPPATTPAEAAAARPPVVDGWVVRTVSRGVAVIQGRRMGVIEVERGDIVPGLGRIEQIRRQDGQWVVVTAKGLILPPTR